ncbi:MAG: peroxiredoxin [Flavobacteriaceae bacterium]|nr:peroxiredoxin [Flavobacteriaceae bacterium]
MMIELEDKAPLFTLKDQNDNDFSIEKFVGEKTLVIFFYPKDFTPGCVKEVCAFRDQYQDFKDYGVEVIGISSDGLKSHQKFAEKHNLPFTLLSDPKGKIRKLFGVPSSLLGLLPGRMTFVIDKNGIVKMRFNNQFGAEKHIEEALKVLKQQKIEEYKVSNKV